MFDVSNWVASLNGENGPRGTTSHEALSVSPQGALEISSTSGQPPSLDRSHLCTPSLVAESCKCDERLTPSSQRPQYPTRYRRLKRRLGLSLRTKFYRRSVVSPGKRASHKRPRIKSCLSGPETLQRPVSGQNRASCDGQLNCGGLHKQTRGNTLSRDVCTEGLGYRCSKHKLDGSHCLCLPSNGSPSQGDPKNQAMQLSDHTNLPRLARDALVLGPSTALNRDPTAAPGVDNTPQAVPQLRVLQQPATPQPPRLVSRSGQLQEQGLSVEVAERIAAPQRSSTRTIYKSKWALFEKWCRENLVDFSTPCVKQISHFFMYLYQDLNRRPSTIDGYRTAIVDTLDPSGQHIAHNEDLMRLLPVSTRIAPKVPENSSSGTFLLFSMSSQKHPLSL